MQQSSAVLAFPRNDQDRLRLALRRLEDALLEQAGAVQEFRARLGELRQATTGLDSSLGVYRTALSGTATELRRAHHAASELKDTAARLEALG
jgi:chromosome segregation ATPase